MDFDLDTIETRELSDAGVPMVVMTVAGEPLLAKNGQPVTLVLLGPDSEAYRKGLRDQVRQRVARQDKTSIDEQEFDEIEQDALDLLSKCMKGWDNMLDRAGQPIPFSTAGARELLERFPVIRDQVDRFIANRANFLKASATT